MANWRLEDIGQALSAFSEWDRSRKLNPFHKDGQSVSGEFVKIAAGPPTLRAPETGSSTNMSNIVWPIGVAQGLTFTSNIQQFTIYELGSKAEYNCTGRSAVQIGFGDIYLWGPNLLRLVYGWKKDNPPGALQDRWEVLWGDENASYQDDWTIHISPGNRIFWMNVFSDIFSRPFGLLLLIEDNTETTLAAPYLERCFITAYGWDVDPNGILMRENLTVIPHNIKYVEVAEMELEDEFKSAIQRFFTSGGE